MLSILLMTALASASCPEIEFEFVGQPECVHLEYEAGHTRLLHTCTHPVLLDQSVQLQTGSRSPTAVLPPQTEILIRDLSAFTLGMNGELYRAVAMLRTCDPPA